MAQLPPEAIAEFRDIWKDEYGEDLSIADATVRAHEVFTLISMIARKLDELQREGTPERHPHSSMIK